MLQRVGVVLSWFFKWTAYLGFVNLNYILVHGPKKRLHLGRDVGLANTLFNTRSGEIHVGDGTIFGHHCMVLTGVHQRQGESEHYGHVPESGGDIRIGKNCWIASGVTIVGNVSIGDRTIVAAGAVVTKSLPADSFCAGVPARVIPRAT